MLLRPTFADRFDYDALLCSRGSEDAPFGVAAYQAWIEYLLAPVPADIAGDPRRIEPLYRKHDAPIGELAERRAYASTFLSQAADVMPDVAVPLHRAEHCHKAMHDLLWRVWQTLGAWNRMDDAKLLRFAEQDVRVELASLVRRLQAWDAESAKHMCDALLQTGVVAADLQALAATAGWQLKVVDMPPDEEQLAAARRINDVVLSCLYGLPVATTHNGKPAVVVGYNHLAGETLRVRLPGQKRDQPPSRIRINDKGWGPTWVFLVARQ